MVNVLLSLLSPPIRRILTRGKPYWLRRHSVFSRAEKRYLLDGNKR